MTGQASWCNTSATRALNVEIPIVLGPFGGASSVELTATVSQKGGLGSYGLYGYSPDRILETNREIRSATSKPYALNVWLPLDGCEEVRPSEEQFAAYLQPLLPYFAELGVTPPSRPDSYLPTFDSQIEAVFEARPPIISFVYGVPPANVLDRARSSALRHSRQPRPSTKRSHLTTRASISSSPREPKRPVIASPSSAPPLTHSSERLPWFRRLLTLFLSRSSRRAGSPTDAD